MARAPPLMHANHSPLPVAPEAPLSEAISPTFLHFFDHPSIPSIFLIDDLETTRARSASVTLVNCMASSGEKMASTSPWDTTSPASGGQRSAQDFENLEKKRARDRKSQKAMRERTKWNIQCLNHQVEQLQRALDIETREKNDLHNKFLAMSEENDHLRVQKAALQLRLLGNGQSPPDSASSPTGLAPFETIPMNTTPTCMSDQILQTFVESRWEAYAFQTAGRLEYYPDKPDLSALFDGRPNRQVDETSSIVGDIVRSYTEIDTLPKKVAVHYIMSTLLKWEVLRTKASYQAMPEWLRPEQVQLERPHASWIDRLPWSVRLLRPCHS